MNSEIKERKAESHSFLLLAACSLIGAFVAAFAFIVTIQFSLPPTDSAYHQGLSATLSDPFVVSIASTVALISGVIGSPFLYFGLRQKKLKVALPIVLGSVLVTIAVVTPFSILGGWITSYVAFLISLLVCAGFRMNFKTREN